MISKELYLGYQIKDSVTLVFYYRRCLDDGAYYYDHTIHRYKREDVLITKTGECPYKHVSLKQTMLEGTCKFTSNMVVYSW